LGLRELNKVIQAFLPHESLNDFSKLTIGHINQTYIVYGRFSSYVLQQINTQVFTDPNYLNELKVRLSAEMREHIDYPITYFPPVNLAFESWACSNFLRNSSAHEFCVSGRMAQGLGKRLGQFHTYTKDLSCDDFKEIIPSFHDMQKRMQQLEQAKEGASEKRLELSIPLFEIINRYRREIFSLTNCTNLDKHIVHNDAKCSNFLFDSFNNCLCVIDLDTVMPGYFAYDFGDAIRSISCLKKEDANYPGLPKIELEKVAAFIKTYAGETKSIFSTDEVSSLVLGVYHMTAIMGIRFLADFLNDDQYFKTTYPKQNFYRAQHQLKLLDSQIQLNNKLQNIVNQHFEV